MQSKVDIDKIRTMKEDGLQVVDVEEKGKGVMSTRKFKKGELLCEYRGECLSLKAARCREKEYLQMPESGCFMYYFTYKHMTLWLVQCKCRVIVATCFYTALIPQRQEGWEGW